MKRIIFFFIFCFSIFLKQALSFEIRDTVFITENENQFDVYKQLYLLEDKADTIKFQQIFNGEIDSHFKINLNDETPNFGFTHSGYWLKLKIKNMDESQKIILDVPYPFFNKLVVYIPDTSENYKIRLVGDHFPFSQRGFSHKNFLFPIYFYHKETKTIYMHISCDGEATSFPVFLMKPLRLTQINYEEQTILGFYYGILVFALFLSIFLGISLQEKINYQYFLYVIGVGTFQLSLDGMAFQYLWPNNVWLANHIIPMAGSFAIFFLIKFAQYLLLTKKHTPKLCKLLNVIAIVDALLFFISMLPNPFYSFSLKALNLLGLVSNIVILIAAISVYRKGFRPARYFLIAFLLLIIGVLSAMLKNFGWLPRVFLTEYGIQIGSGVEIIFLSFALSERVKVLKDEKQEAQNQLFEQLQENNRMQIELNVELEKKVHERTLEIQEQNKIISEKNKDITDSINYAKRIQEALLSKAEAEAITDENLFILFRPRDIVSGDFYWYTEQDSKLIIAAVDCTGHGVPGALMSMIGSTLLYSIVNDIGITQPKKILRLMNENIQLSLKQKSDYSSNRDGMDMAICTIDFKARTLTYGGAQRPLYFVRNGVLQEYKASSFSIGGFIDGIEKTFEQTTIEYEMGDMIYIFSDGYADQFGGVNTKKFMTKNLKKLLTEVSAESNYIQKEMVEHAFISWMGNNPQVDDILIMGLRL